MLLAFHVGNAARHPFIAAVNWRNIAIALIDLSQTGPGAVVSYANLAGMNRPAGITVTTILMAICNAMGWLIIDYSSPHAHGTFVIFTVLILAGYAVLVAYWKGKNWARILVLINSVITILNLRYWNLPSPTILRTPNRVMIASEFAIGIFLLYWLNTSCIRAFFKGSKA